MIGLKRARSYLFFRELTVLSKMLILIRFRES